MNVSINSVSGIRKLLVAYLPMSTAVINKHACYRCRLVPIDVLNSARPRVFTKLVACGDDPFLYELIEAAKYSSS